MAASHLDLATLTVKIFADGADLDSIRAQAAQPHIKGFTTNPSLMRKAGVADYAAYSRELLAAVPDYSVSLEVFADDPAGMIAQGREIASWGSNAVVKVPVINSTGVFTGPVIEALSQAGVPLNITAVYTVDQVHQILGALHGTAPAYISIFAGRLADSGWDPLPVMREAASLLAERPGAGLDVAGGVGVFAFTPARDAGGGCITVPPEVLDKLSGLGTTADALAMSTGPALLKDATAAGYSIDTTASAAAE